jgi:UDP-N-acetylmuramoylalanine-D-glutamate ligase
MTVEEIVKALGLQVITAGEIGREVTGGYASDLLSCVMAKAQVGNIWVTLQAHPNVVAVASLLGLAAVIISEGIKPDHETVERAKENGVTLLGSPQTTFAVVGRLSAAGVGSGQ